MKKFGRLGVFLSVCLLALSAYAGSKDSTLILEDEKLFKKMKNPAISQFNVSFANSDIKQAGSYKDEWRKLDGKSESAMRVNLKGLSDATMQKITDAAYADFKAKLEQAGINAGDANLNEVPKWIKKEFDRYTREGYPENHSHYEAYGAVESKTVPRSGSKVIDPKFGHLVGFPAKEAKQEMISVRYLLHFGYLETKSSRSENYFMNEISLKTGVTFYPGIQVYWRSGAEVYHNHKKKGSILIKEHVGAPGEYGEMKLVEESNWDKAYKELDITVDEEKYYKLAVDALSQANTKIVNQIANL